MAGKDSHVKHHECMNTFFRIIGCGNLQQVATQKAEGGLLAKRAVVLQELGGRMADQYVVTLLGESAARPLAPGDLVAGRLRFKTHEHNGQVYQDIECYELVKLNA